MMLLPTTIGKCIKINFRLDFKRRLSVFSTIPKKAGRKDTRKGIKLHISRDLHKLDCLLREGKVTRGSKDNPQAAPIIAAPSKLIRS